MTTKSELKNWLSQCKKKVKSLFCAKFTSIKETRALGAQLSKSYKKQPLKPKYYAN
jgi:hypothetical protein